MKKYIVGLFVLSLVFLVGSVVKAEVANTTSVTTQSDVSYNLGTTTLKNGSRGEAAKELQRFLNDKLDLNLSLDGVIGPKTIAVMKQWQSKNGLVADGLIGPKTKAIIYSIKSESTNSRKTAGDIFEQPNTQKFEGYLTAQGPTTTMWGTHTIVVNSETTCLTNVPCAQSALARSYPISANNSVAVLAKLKLYENSNVTILGKLSYYDLEGGFLGIIANNVIPESSISDSPVISGISGPVSLNVNKEGKWTVSATNQEEGVLSYSVDWGEVVGNDCSSLVTPCMALKEAQLFQQSATFTHTYSNAGVYSPTFTVTSDNGIRCVTTPCPTGGSATASITVKVGNPISTSSITILSPNGGETLIKKDNETIKWQDNEIYSCEVGVLCDPIQRFYDVSLVPYYTPCTSNICPMMAIHMPYTIIKNTPELSYNWQVGNVVASSLVDSVVADGAYTIQVCRTGTNICDSSNSYFKVVTNTDTNSTCKDSDNGLNLNVAGVTTSVLDSIANSFADLSVTSNGDTCSGTSCTGVIEGYCENGIVKKFVYQCPTGVYSINGVCVLN